MLNSNKEKQQNMILWGVVALFIILGIVFISFAFGGGSEEGAVPTADINLLYTNAAMTISAQQLTLQAGLPATPATTATFSIPATAGGLLLSPTISTQQPLVTNTTAGGCDNSAYVSDVTVADGTAIALGQSFTKTWRVSNTGTCTWTATYQIIFISGEAMSGKSTPIGKVVAPGQVADISVTLVAPSKAGDVKGIWRLMNDKNQGFGTTLTVVIKAGGATATYTGTPPTATPSKTKTPVTPVTAPPTDPPTDAPTEAPTEAPTNPPANP